MLSEHSPAPVTRRLCLLTVRVSGRLKIAQHLSAGIDVGTWI